MAKEKKKKKGGCLKGVLPFTVLAFAAVYTFFYLTAEKDIAKEHLKFEQYFKGNFEKYLAVEEENLFAEPFRTGKVLVIKSSPDKYGVWLNAMFYDLPPEMQAHRPEEVSTVIVVEYSKEVYVQGVRESSEIWNAYFRIIDWPSRSIIYRGVIEGEPPAGEDQMGEGEIPSWEMFAFIENLPIKEI